MPIDTSFYASGAGAAGPQQNPLGQMALLAQTQNALNQNLLFQQQFKARNALGAVAQQAIDPQTGAIDWNKYAVGVSVHPDTAYLAPDILNSITQRKFVDQETIAKALSTAQQRFGAIGNSAAALVAAGHANGDKVDRGDIISSLALLKGQGLIKDDDQTQFLMSTSQDPRANYALLLKVAQQAQGAEKSLGNTFQAISTPAGGYTQLGTRNVYGGTYAPVGGPGNIEHAPTPGELSAPTATVNPATGQPMTAPRAAVMPTYGGLGSQMTSPQGIAQQGAALQGGGAPQVWSPNVAPITGSPQGSTTPSPSPTPGPAGAVPTGLTPYKADALKQIADKYEPDLNERARNANQLQLLMAQTRDETNNFKTGGGAASYMKMGQLAQAMGIKDEAVNKLANGDIASSQAANKLFMQVGSMIASQLVHAGGGRMTQTEWSQVLANGAANIDMDPKAIAKIFAAMREVTHFTGLESQAFGAAKQRYEAGNYDLTQFQNDWQKHLGNYIAGRKGTPASVLPAGAP